MKRTLFPRLLLAVLLFPAAPAAMAQTTIIKKGEKYDTIIRKHSDKPATKPAKKPVAKPQPPKPEIVIPVPEYINQPYYYDKDDNKLVKLENATAQMTTKKKTLGLQGARKVLGMETASSKIRFTAKKDLVFFIKTGGDDIDLTSYIRLYRFVAADERREVTVNAKEGLINDKEEGKGKLVNFSVKMMSKDNYMIQLPDQLEAGEYGFVWVKNMELKEFTVFAFGLDWKSSD
jgi:hypothetical protein